MENLYDILEIDKNASKKEIKLAYVKLLRMYPPEQNNDKFQNIRKAYEILSNEKSRNEYDAFFEHGDEIKELEKIAEEYLIQGEFKKAIIQYKKILIINPNLNFAKNSLGLALAYDNQLDKALEQFKELLEIDKENATYNANMAHVYLKKEEYLSAEKYFLIAHEIDSINDSIISELVELYIEKKKYKKAIMLLRSCIGKYKDDNFRDFTYYLQMIRVYIFESNTDMIESIVNKIIDVVPSDEKIKDYVSRELGKLAYDLYEVKLFEESEIIANKAKEIGNDELIGLLYEESKRLNESYTLYKKLLDDDRIVGPAKGPIVYFMESDEYEEEELKKHIDENLDAIQSYINNDPNELKHSIDMIRCSYNLLYEYRKELYLEISKSANKSIIRKSKYDQMRDDEYITNGLKRIIALWIVEGITEKERDEYFEDIMNEINHEDLDKLYFALNRLKSNYTVLYELNSDFMDELKNHVSKARNNNITRNYSNSNNSSISNNYSTSNSYSNTNSSSSGFGTCILFAIIGGVFFGPIGAIVGFFIGLAKS